MRLIDLLDLFDDLFPGGLSHMLMGRLICMVVTRMVGMVMLSCLQRLLER